MRISDWRSDVCSSDLPTLSDKKRGLRIARQVQREVSRYLLTISLINAGLGVAIAIGMWAVGMPNPILWGLIGGVINFVPYLGAAAGILLVGEIGLVSFDTPGQALLAPAVYALCTITEGQIITPMLRSEEHTSELQSLMRISYAVFCLKKQNNKSYCTT